jgi:Protein of unknown function (DUF2938)
MIASIIDVVLIGAGATLCIDLWSLFLRKAFGIRGLDLCYLGRWVLHMLWSPEPDSGPRAVLNPGRFVHRNIAATPAKPHECKVGWTAHYSIGVAFALLFVGMAPEGWLARPTFLPAFAFGVATTVVPLFVMQPALGMGFASSRAPSPWAARLRSLGTHVVFGAGMYAVAKALTLLR